MPFTQSEYHDARGLIGAGAVGAGAHVFGRVPAEMGRTATMRLEANRARRSDDGVRGGRQRPHDEAGGVCVW